MLDRIQCRLARESRDPRFDGAFYTAVKTTGIFCRPICSARAPKEDNVDYYPSAASALNAGFRPCLRCRPEAAPLSSAWCGVKTTAARAFAIIESGFLVDHSISDLAARLGIGERYLRQLCQRNYGASPVQLERCRRLLTAKRLLSESNTNVNDIAFLAGFNSVRRFNESFKLYMKQTPSDCRRHPIAVTEQIKSHIVCSENYDFLALLDFLRPRLIEGVEIIDNARYSRLLSVRDQVVHIEVGMVKAAKKPTLEIVIGRHDFSVLPEVIRQITKQFDVATNSKMILAHLGRDAKIQEQVSRYQRRYSDLRVALTSSPFEAGIRAIVGQQISVKGARTILARIVARHGQKVTCNHPLLTRVFPRPTELASANLEGLGLTTSRINTLHAFSAAVAADPSLLDEHVDDQQRRKKLLSIKGVGPWTVNYIEMRGMGIPDAFPAGDLGIRKALMHQHHLPSIDDVEQSSQPWRPWRAYASILLWAQLAMKAAESDIN